MARRCQVWKCLTCLSAMTGPSTVWSTLSSHPATKTLSSVKLFTKVLKKLSNGSQTTSRMWQARRGSHALKFSRNKHPSSCDFSSKASSVADYIAQLTTKSRMPAITVESLPSDPGLLNRPECKAEPIWGLNLDLTLLSLVTIRRQQGQLYAPAEGGR